MVGDLILLFSLYNAGRQGIAHSFSVSNILRNIEDTGDDIVAEGIFQMIL